MHNRDGMHDKMGLQLKALKARALRRWWAYLDRNHKSMSYSRKKFLIRSKSHSIRYSVSLHHKTCKVFCNKRTHKNDQNQCSHCAMQIFHEQVWSMRPFDLFLNLIPHFRNLKKKHITDRQADGPTDGHTLL